MAIVLALILSSAGPVIAAPKSLNGFVGDRPVVDTGGLFSQPRDVAVYTAGTPGRADDKVFVVEASTGPNHRVHRLDGDGNFERLWGKDVIRPGFPGNTGDGFEVCTAALSGAAGCQGGDNSGDDGGEFDDATGVAVNQASGHVYVIDRDNRRVQEFTLDGGFVRAWGWGVETGAIAFEVCNSPGACQAGVPGTGSSQFGSSSAIHSIAVSPIDGDVLVTDPANQRLLRFESDGDFVEAIGAGDFNTAWPQHVAVDADGIVYASDSTLPEAALDNRIVRFDAAATLLDPLKAPEVALLSARRTAGLEIDPATGNLLVVRDSSSDGKVIATVQEIEDPGTPVSGAPPHPIVIENHVLAEPADNLTGAQTRNLGVDPATGNIYLATPQLLNPNNPDGIFTGCETTASSDCSGLVALAQATSALSGVMSAPTAVEATSVQLAGTVDPAGGVARYRFQISADGASWTSVGDPRYVAGSGATPVSVQATGLEPSTGYRARLLVTKQTDISVTASVVSNEGVFVTDTAPPVVTTLGSSHRTDTSVRLRGLVDASGTDTTYRFEYGPDGGSFDTRIPIPDAQAGSGNTSQLRTQDVTGLLPDTAYHYRVVATNDTGTSFGAAVTFTTRVTPPPPTPPAGRGYELVSPADKVSGVGAGIWYHGPSAAGIVGFGAYDAERFAVTSTFGAVMTDGKFSFANDVALAERTSQGWTFEPAASRRAYGSQTLTFLSPSGATPDLGLMAYSNVGLKLFEEQEDWIKEEAGTILYFRDWSAGKWELFGPTAPEQGGGLGATVRIADDGRSAVASAEAGGLAGDGDPTTDLPSGVQSVFLYELPEGGPSDVFPGMGARSVGNVCDSGTEIPARVDVGGELKQAGQPCPAPDGGDSAALISGTRGAVLGADREDVISEDGSRVFFMSPDPGTAAASCSGTGEASACPAQLFVRQREESGAIATRWISRTEVTQANGALEDQDASLMGEVIFEGASRDGDKVFFRTNSPLTADDPNGEGSAPPAGGIVTGSPSDDSWDLYMYDMPNGPNADPADGDLTRISAGPNGKGDCNSPFAGGTGSGALRFVSEDGSRLYFTCAAPLPASPPPGVPVGDSGTITIPGGTPSTSSAANLYMFDANKSVAQRWRFVARLPRSSVLGACATTGIRPGNPIAPTNDQDPGLVVQDPNCVHGTVDGTFITFFTDGQLTDDDPDASSGDIYAYDATRDELIRASAPQGGPGGTYPCILISGGPRCYASDGIGGTGGLPKLNVAEDPGGDRVVFFHSQTPLVKDDQDSAYDVYQWRNGVLSLISSDKQVMSDVFYVGNDRTGRNVYMATRERLSWEDHDVVLDVYTARLGGGFKEPESIDETCDPALDECQGPGQQLGSKAVDTDEPGAGNLPSARRLKVTLRAPSAKQRRKAARTGDLPIRISTTAAATLTTTAKARLRGRRRAAAKPVKRTIGDTRTVVIRLKLNKQARQRLNARKTLRLTIVAKAATARIATMSVALRR